MKKTVKYALASLISLMTFAVYLFALQNDFVPWDDSTYVFENTNIRSLDSAFLRWAFSTFYAGNWHPLTWISHALDYAMWGLDPMGHHLTNIVLHAINTFLVVLLVVKLMEIGQKLIDDKISPNPSFSKRGTLLAPPLEKGDKGEFSDKSILITAATAGLLFGLHPIHVESVAWVAERKDLLCALFFLLSILVYTRYLTPPSPSYVKRGWQSRGSYFLSFLFFVLALLSKPMAVSLPFILLILDWHPFGRIRSMKTLSVAVSEKIPFIVLSLVSSVLTVLAQKAAGATSLMEYVPLQDRLAVAIRSLGVYLWKMFFPVSLYPIYPYPSDVSLFSYQYLLTIALVVGISITCVLMIKRQKIWLAAWGYYVVTLIPVLGIVQVGSQAMADRYTYLPGLGPFLLCGLAVSLIWSRANAPGKRFLFRIAVVPVFLVLLVSLTYRTVEQIGIWKNGFTLWTPIIEKEPGKAIPTAYNNRANFFLRMGEFDKAIADYDKVLTVYPSDPVAYIWRKIAIISYVNRGKSYLGSGNYDLAVSDFQKACDYGNEEGCRALQAMGLR